MSTAEVSAPIMKSTGIWLIVLIRQIKRVLWHDVSNERYRSIKHSRASYKRLPNDQLSNIQLNVTEGLRAVIMGESSIFISPKAGFRKGFCEYGNDSSCFTQRGKRFDHVISYQPSQVLYPYSELQMKKTGVQCSQEITQIFQNPAPEVSAFQHSHSVGHNEGS